MTSRARLLVLCSWLFVATQPSLAADTRAGLQTHSTREQKGDLDLEASDIHKEPHIWENVLDQIELGEMPPKKEKQLSAEEEKQLVTWVRGTLDQIALANTGDPGPVVLRRLSNIEYTYTIRDLTSIESLDPAKEFPVDGAAGEGFTNAGAALVISPALLTKYLDAAKGIANHAVFTPKGFHFSSSTSSQDWTDEVLTKIREFYARFTVSGHGTAVDLHGIKFDTNGGGLLPLSDTSPPHVMARLPPTLNTKYLRTLRAALESPEPSLVLDLVRHSGEQVPPPQTWLLPSRSGSMRCGGSPPSVTLASPTAPSPGRCRCFRSPLAKGCASNQSQDR